MESEKPVIIYDGNCRLCQRAVLFLRTKSGTSGLEFFPSTGSEANQLMHDYQVPSETTAHTVILINKNRVYTKSDAVIRALQMRSGMWRISGILLVIPAFLRNLIYDWVARTRRPADQQTRRPADQETRRPADLKTSGPINLTMPCNFLQQILSLRKTDKVLLMHRVMGW